MSATRNPTPPGGERQQKQALAYLYALHLRSAALLLKLAQSEPITDADKREIQTYPGLSRELLGCCGIEAMPSDRPPPSAAPEGHFTHVLCSLHGQSANMLTYAARYTMAGNGMGLAAQALHAWAVELAASVES